jgi:hypothetical protein
MSDSDALWLKHSKHYSVPFSPPRFNHTLGPLEAQAPHQADITSVPHGWPYLGQAAGEPGSSSGGPPDEQSLQPPSPTVSSNASTPHRTRSRRPSREGSPMDQDVQDQDVQDQDVQDQDAPGTPNDDPMAQEEDKEQPQPDEDGEGPPETTIDDQMDEGREGQQQGSSSLAVSQRRRSGIRDDSAYRASGSRYLTRSTNRKRRLQNSSADEDEEGQNSEDEDTKWRSSKVEVVNCIDLTQEVDPEPTQRSLSMSTQQRLLDLETLTIYDHRGHDFYHPPLAVRLIF